MRRTPRASTAISAPVLRRSDRFVDQNRLSTLHTKGHCNRSSENSASDVRCTHVQICARHSSATFSATNKLPRGATRTSRKRHAKCGERTSLIRPAQKPLCASANMTEHKSSGSIFISEISAWGTFGSRAKHSAAVPQKRPPSLVCARDISRKYATCRPWVRAAQPWMPLWHTGRMTLRKAPTAREEVCDCLPTNRHKHATGPRRWKNRALCASNRQTDTSHMWEHAESGSVILSFQKKSARIRYLKALLPCL